MAYFLSQQRRNALIQCLTDLSMPLPAARDYASYSADSDDLARVYRFDLAQDSEMISPTIPI